MYIYEGYFNNKNSDNDSLITDIEQTSINQLNTVNIRMKCMLYKDYPKSLEEFQLKLKHTWHKYISILNILYNIEDVISYSFTTYNSETEEFEEVDFKNNDCYPIFNNSRFINNHRMLFADFKLLLNEPFTIKTLDLLCKRAFTYPKNNTIKPYVFVEIGFNGKNINFHLYYFKDDKPVIFFPNMTRFASGIIPIEEHPIQQVSEYYKLPLSKLMKHYMESSSYSVKTFQLSSKKLNYNQVYLFNQYTIEYDEHDSKYGWCSLSLDKESTREKTKCDYFCDLSENDIETLCKKSADYVINNSDTVDLMMLNRYNQVENEPSGLCYIFNKTFVYNELEYIVILMLGYETELAQYKISNDKALIIIDTLVNDFHLSTQDATKWLVDDEIIYEK